MQVNPSGTYSQPIRTAANAPAKPADPATASATPPVTDPGAFTPTGDLARLIALVRNAPDVRADVVAAAAAKAEAGELDTPAAAADTARAFLQSGD